jgi:hypothetical protein
MFYAESNSKAVLSSCQNVKPWSPSYYNLGVADMIPTTHVEEHLLSICSFYHVALSRLAARVIPTARPISHPPTRARRDALFTQASTVSSCAFREQRDVLAVRPLPYCHSDKILSVIFFYFPQLVAGWKGEASRARIDRYTCSFQACSFLSRDGG